MFEFIIKRLLTKEVAGSIIRKLLVMAGTYAAAVGVTETDWLNMVAAVVPVLLGIFWSLYNKEQQKA